jgi:hypothetical protein
MKLVHLLLVVSFCGVSGCGGDSSERRPASDTKAKAEASAAKTDAKIEAALAQLDPADRRLAEAQKYCPVMTNNRLGSMGKPYKVMVEDQAVFLCCEGCKKKALADPEKTLAKVKELREKAQ